MISGLKQVDIPLAKGLPFFRTVFFQPDSVSADELVVAGIDPLVPSDALKNALNGPNVLRMNKVYKPSKLYHNRASGFKDITCIANLKYENVKKVTKLLAHPESLNPMSIPMDCLENRFIEKCRRYNDPDAARRQADEFISLMDKELARKQGATLETEPDADGFTLATGATSKSADGIVVQSFKPLNINGSGNRFLESTGLSASNQLKKKKRKGGQHDDFYRFQIRQQKQEEFENLKRQHDTDILTIEAMRQAKKFKPI